MENAVLGRRGLLSGYHSTIFFFKKLQRRYTVTTTLHSRKLNKIDRYYMAGKAGQPTRRSFIPTGLILACCLLIVRILQTVFNVKAVLSS